jgi:tRNA G10  N-methylase Trm11
MDDDRKELISEVRHPAKFTDVLIDAIADVFREFIDPVRILDPFAGTGRVHLLRDRSTMLETVGIEIEPEWASMRPNTVIGNALNLPFKDESFDAIVTSPCYGNRMADHHEAADASRRVTYRHTLGRPLHPDNSGRLQWGSAYKSFHREAWEESVRVLRHGGLFVLNVSDHIRAGQRARVTKWHVETLLEYGLELLSCTRVPTPRMGFGANARVRVPYESVIVFDK